MLETAEMPPADAELIPSKSERTAAAAAVRTALNDYLRAHAGEPGRVTVRRLTSGEYAYAIRDLTGIDIPVGIDASSDAVGGEGFTNFGDVQFVQDANIERYLEAAKRAAEHAIIGAGPLEFSPDTGRSGLELFAINRINDLHSTKGFRLVSGEGGLPFGLEKYGKAFYVAWYYKHRAALGDRRATLRDLAAKEGLTEKLAELIWSTVIRTNLGYPSRETAERWKALPPPTTDVQASLEKARAGCDEIYKALTNWPVWFFDRGALAKDGKGDESPLVFNDKSLGAVPAYHYVFPVGGARFGRGFGFGGGFGGGGGQNGPAAAKDAPATPPLPAAAAAPTKILISLTDLNPRAGVSPVVIWRNPRVVTRAFPTGGRGGRGTGDPAATALAAADGDVNDTNLAGRRARAPVGPILSETPLRTLLSAEAAAALAFGKSPDGIAIGPDDFATTGPVTLEFPAPSGSGITSLEVDAELGTDRNTVVRLALTDRAAGAQALGGAGGFGARGGQQGHVLLGDPANAGYKAFRASIAEYLALMPPNSHGEASPADKDPVPWPFDSTYNTPEHDAFVLKVKYQRTDQFFADYMLDEIDRVRLNQAWNNLLGSFPYHDGYLSVLADHYQVKLKSPHIQDIDAAQMATIPAEMQPQVAALRTSYNEVTKTLTLAQPGHIEDALAFAGRAWRRPLTSAEKTRLRTFYEHSRKEIGLNHDAAIRALLARILVSQSFLYRVEAVADRAERPLNNWEMASRLSFFLWSSIPDEELRRAAAAGELTKPASLEKQVRRMTADPKARRLATEFFGQWLGFYHFDEYRGIDTGRFPEFTDEVKSAMYEESVSTFEYLVRQNRPVKEILYGDYTFLNQPLAKFYRIDQEVKSMGEMVKIDGANAFNRGGALRLGSVLAITSAPLRTSPVKRGDWILRRILGTPTPPPPGDVAALAADPKSFGDLTLREKLAEHKTNPTCASCHVKIDPLGFPLEGFDAVGRTRASYEDGKPIDATGELTNKSVINGADGLLGYLKDKEPQVMKTLAKKMLGYALGRTVLPTDRQLVNEMVAAGGNATFANLAVKIATSRQFRNRAGDADTAPGTSGVTTVSTPSRNKDTN